MKPPGAELCAHNEQKRLGRASTLPGQQSAGTAQTAAKAKANPSPPVGWPVTGRQVLLPRGGRADRTEGAAKAAAAVQQAHCVQACWHAKLRLTAGRNDNRQQQRAAARAAGWC